MDQSTQIAQKINEKRKEMKFSKTELAYRAGIARLTLHRFIAGQTITLNKLIPVLEQLGLKIKIEENED